MERISELRTTTPTEETQKKARTHEKKKRTERIAQLCGMLMCMFGVYYEWEISRIFVKVRKENGQNEWSKNEMLKIEYNNNYLLGSSIGSFCFFVVIYLGISSYNRLNKYDSLLLFFFLFAIQSKKCFK